MPSLGFNVPGVGSRWPVFRCTFARERKRSSAAWNVLHMTAKRSWTSRSRTSMFVECRTRWPFSPDSSAKISVFWHTTRMGVNFTATEPRPSCELESKRQMDADRLNAYLERVYPLTDKQRKDRYKPERWNRVMELFEIGDAPKLAPSHTLWGAYNAVTRYEDYRQANEAGPDRRLNRVWFGHGADLKLRALSAADALRQQWDKLSCISVRDSQGRKKCMVKRG